MKIQREWYLRFKQTHDPVEYTGVRILFGRKKAYRNYEGLYLFDWIGGLGFDFLYGFSNWIQARFFFYFACFKSCEYSGPTNGRTLNHWTNVWMHEWFIWFYLCRHCRRSRYFCSGLDLKNQMDVVLSRNILKHINQLTTFFFVFSWTFIYNIYNVIAENV